MKYLVVTGGVVSGLGKGISISSMGVMLKACGLRVTAIKIDPYLNSDAGTMSPFEHGEVFVLNDGGEADLDLGNYERERRACARSCARERASTRGRTARARARARCVGRAQRAARRRDRPRLRGASAHARPPAPSHSLLPLRLACPSTAPQASLT